MTNNDPANGQGWYKVSQTLKDMTAHEITKFILLAPDWQK